MRISVVVPAHQASAVIEPCLAGLLKGGFARTEIVVVDDGSRDGTGERARAHGVTVIRNGTAQGPARARNRGAEAVDSEVIAFVDADVIVHPGTRARIAAHFRSAPDLAAVFGSYDDSPAARSVVGRYRNLLHHFVHQHAAAEAGTFWTGLGAVRRDALLRLGGFDPAWQAIEDVEFGVRLRRAGGRIALDRALLGTHLKAWTLSSMLRTDLLGRAVPWSRLLSSGGEPMRDLNLSASHRVSALAVALFAASAAAGALDTRFLAGTVAAGAVFLLANRRFLGFLARRHGPLFALRAIPFHALHYAAAALGYAWVLVVERPLRRRGGRSPDRPSGTGLHPRERVTTGRQANAPSRGVPPNPPARAAEGSRP